MKKSDLSRQDKDVLLDRVGAAFARLRRRTGQMDVSPPVGRKDLARNIVINVIDESPNEMSVGRLAEQLNVDPSVASRMVADCIAAGSLVRAASQSDGRQVILKITSEGYALRDRFASQQRQAFEQITSDWLEEDRLRFADLLIRYADAAAQLPHHT